MVFPLGGGGEKNQRILYRLTKERKQFLNL